MAKDTAFPKKNKKSSIEKSDKEKSGRKTGFFAPKKAEAGLEARDELESGAKPRKKSEQAEVKPPEETREKQEKKSEIKAGKKEKREKKSEKYVSSRIPASEFLPMSPEEVKARGWKELDIILVTGDAYVDHSSFGTAIIGRVLEDAGFRVGIIAQPRWDNSEDFKKLGKPRLFFSVSAGNTDSMVSNLTPGLKPRDKDVYSPGGKAGLRPNRAVIIYSNKIKEAFPEVPIVLGGIEASLRRFAHYDYLSDKVRQSILADAPARSRYLRYGRTSDCRACKKRLQAGEDIREIRDIPGTVWKMEVKAWKELKERVKEKDKQEKDKQEKDKQEKDKQEKDKQEKDKQEKDKQEKDKQEKDKQEKDGQEKDEQEKDKQQDIYEEKDFEVCEKAAEFFKDYVEIPSFSDVSQDKEAFAKAFRMYFLEQNPVTGKGVVQPHPKTVIVQNRPMRLLTEAEMDHVYELPFTGDASSLLYRTCPCPGNGKVLPDNAQGLLWRLCLLRHYTASGAHDCKPQY